MITELEQEITEIKKVLNSPQTSLTSTKIQEQQQQKEEFTCSSCSLTKSFDRREKENKNQISRTVLILL